MLYCPRCGIRGHGIFHLMQDKQVGHPTQSCCVSARGSTASAVS